MGFFGSIGKFFSHTFNEIVETAEDVIHGDAQIIKEVEKIGKVVAPVAGGVASLFPATAPFAIPAMIGGTAIQGYSGNAFEDIFSTGVATAGAYGLGSLAKNVTGLGGQAMNLSDIFSPSQISTLKHGSLAPYTTMGKVGQSITDIMNPIFSLAEKGVSALGSIFGGQPQMPMYPMPYGASNHMQGMTTSDYLALQNRSYPQLSQQSYPYMKPVHQFPKEDDSKEKNMFLWLGVGIMIFGLLTVIMK